MSIQIELYIIVVTYNAEKWVDHCFGSFVDKPQNWKVIVIDNGSLDNTVNILKEQYPLVHIIENKKNFGFGKANNIGMKIALEDKAEHVLLLNQDAWISIESIKMLINLQKNNEDYFVISPMHYDANGNDLDIGFNQYIKKNSSIHRDMQQGRTLKKLYTAQYCNAAIWLLSRRALEEIGGFNTSFYHYGEDDNYLDRIFYHHKKLGIAPYVKAFHDRKDRFFYKSKKENLNKDVYLHFVLKMMSNPQILHFELSEIKVFCNLLLRSFYYLLLLNYKKSIACYLAIPIYLKNRQLIKLNLIQTKIKQASFL